MNLITFWDKRIEREAETAAWNTLRKLKSHKNKVAKFDADVELEAVDLDWLERFETYMLSTGNKQNTIASTMSSLKSTLQQAVDRELIAKNPFKKYKIRKAPTFERALLIEDVKKIEELVGKNVYVDAWLFSFYCAGIRIGDICRLYKENVLGGKIEYRMHKNKKRVSLPLNPKAREIADRYLKDGTDRRRLFPLIADHLQRDEEGRQIKSATSRGNDAFKDIKDELGIEHMSWHAARAAFATYMVRKGTDIDTIRQLLKHSSVVTTQEYLASRSDDQLGDIVSDAMDF